MLDQAANQLQVQVDRRLVVRALENFLQNAYKHAGERAQVRLSVTFGPHDLLTLMVDDDGPGIPAEQRAFVFRKFAQGDTRGHGAGLGLTFCALVAQSHGGQIWADTSPLGGARLCLAVPRAAGPAVPPP